MNMIKRLDPRYLILAFLLVFVTVGQLYLGFFQKWSAVFTSVGFAVATELFFFRLRKIRQFPISAIISGLGISLLLSSDEGWPYALAAVLAISLKHLIRYEGRHIFNPNNIALVFMLYMLPEYAVSTPKQWTNGYEVMVLILLLGFVASYSAKRLDTVLAFLVSFVVFALGRSVFFDHPWLWSLGPVLGASFQLFTFFMITDPKTTPPTRKARIWFAVAIAFIDAIMRVLSITNSLFYAAFWVTLLVGIPYRYWRSKRAVEIEGK